MYFNEQQQPGQQPRANPKQVIGGWAAQQYGLESGKHVEYLVSEINTKNGGKMRLVEFFKPYKKPDGTPGKGFSFVEGGIKELVEKINHFMMNYGKERGMFVWQAMPNMQSSTYQAPQAPPSYAQQPNQQQVWGQPPAQQPWQQSQIQAPQAPGQWGAPSTWGPAPTNAPQQQPAFGNATAPVFPGGPGFDPTNGGGGGW